MGPATKIAFQAPGEVASTASEHQVCHPREGIMFQPNGVTHGDKAIWIWYPGGYKLHPHTASQARKIIKQGSISGEQMRGEGRTLPQSSIICYNPLGIKLCVL